MMYPFSPQAPGHEAGIAGHAHMQFPVDVYGQTPSLVGQIDTNESIWATMLLKL